MSHNPKTLLEADEIDALRDCFKNNAARQRQNQLPNPQTLMEESFSEPLNLEPLNTLSLQHPLVALMTLHQSISVQRMSYQGQPALIIRSETKPTVSALLHIFKQAPPIRKSHCFYFDIKTQRWYLAGKDGQNLPSPKLNFLLKSLLRLAAVP